MRLSRPFSVVAVLLKKKMVYPIRLLVLCHGWFATS